MNEEQRDETLQIRACQALGRTSSGTATVISFRLVRWLAIGCGADFVRPHKASVYVMLAVFNAGSSDFEGPGVSCST